MSTKAEELFTQALKAVQDVERITLPANPPLIPTQGYCICDYPELIPGTQRCGLCGANI